MRLIDKVFPKATDFEAFQSTDVLPSKALPFIWYFVRLLKLPLLIVALLYSLISITVAIESYFVGWIVEILSKSGRDAVWSLVLLPLALYIGICQIFGRIASNCGHRITNQVMPLLLMLVRKRLAVYLYGHSYRYFQEDMAGRLAGKVMEMPQAVVDTLVVTLDQLLYMVIVGGTSTVIFATLDWRLSIVAMAFIMLTVLLAFWQVPHFSKTAELAASCQQKTRGQFIDSITNMLLVKLFSRKELEERLLAKSLIETGTAEQSQGRAEVIWHRGQHLLNASMQTSVTLLALWLYRIGALSVGQLTIALTLAISVAVNVWSIMNVASKYFTRFATINDALQTILQSHDIVDPAEPLALPHGRGDVVLDNVTFAYPGRPVFKNFSLDIPGGQKVGLVGPSGAGKSTLMQLLLRLADIQEGSIRIAGQDIREVRQGDLRRAITVIPQATELMHRSICDNILYGDPDAGDERMIAAAKSAFIHETIESLSDQHGNRGYDALVGERGVKLSGGQRQRIAIARAFLKDAPVLILDEATSALDSESERLIQSSFVELFEGRTVIAIAHRLSTIAHLDRIVVLDQGRIVEDGSHAALIAQGGLYARLWALQSGGFIGDSH